MEGLGSRGPQLPSAQVDLVVSGQAVGPRFLCKIQEQLYMDNHRGYVFWGNSRIQSGTIWHILNMQSKESLGILGRSEPFPKKRTTNEPMKPNRSTWARPFRITQLSLSLCLGSCQGRDASSSFNPLGPKLRFLSFITISVGQICSRYHIYIIYII